MDCIILIVIGFVTYLIIKKNPEWIDFVKSKFKK
jgi:hypothetical protein